MNEILRNSLFFGLAITIFTFWLGTVFLKKVKWSFLSPVIISSAIIIAFLLIFRVEFTTYEQGTQLLNYLLTPTTVCLAIPLYRQIDLLKKHFGAIIIAITCGSLAHLSIIILGSIVVEIDYQLVLSLLPKSVTTPIALGISGEVGGIESVTVFGVTVAGMIGASVGPVLVKLFGIKNHIAQGLAIGTSSHALGTSRAIEMGEIQGAMSSLAIVVTGILTVILMQICV